MRLASPLVILALALAPAAAAQTGASSSAPAKDDTAAQIARSASPELVGLLSKELGITPKQAEAGAGAVFGYAKKALKPADYQKVAKAVPGIDGLEKAAPPEEKPAEGDTLGALAGAASQLGGTTGAVASLGPTFQKLGLSTETVVKFIPVVVGFVTKKGGTSTGDLLGSVFK